MKSATMGNGLDRFVSSRLRRATFLASVVTVLAAAGCGGGGESARNDAPQIAPATVQGHFRRLNEIRSALGISPLSWNDALASSARDHAVYLSENRSIGHEQIPGNPAFTGSDIVRRLSALGFDGTLVQETTVATLSQSADSGAASMDTMMQVPLHRLQLLAQEFDSAGVGISDKGERLVTDMARTKKYAPYYSKIIAYPHDGQKGLPPGLMPGIEVGLPEDLPGTVGTPLTLSAGLFSKISYKQVLLVEENSTQPLPLVAATPAGDVAGALIFFPSSPLKPWTKYVWMITAIVDEMPVKLSSRFITSEGIVVR